AERGHDVTLFGASAEPGGKLAWEAALPGRAEYRNVIAWMERQLRQAGAKVELGQVANVGDIRALNPEHVILATGSHQRPPDDFVGKGFGAREWPARANGRGGATAVLFDMDHSAATYAVADALAQAYRQLILLTPRTQIARNVNYCSAIGVHRRLYEANATIVMAAEPVSLRNGILVWRNVFTGREQEIRDVALFLWSTPRIADDALAAPLRDAGIDTRLAGDCMAPRNLFCAIHEGEAAGMAI
ncbi:MAG: hypothetical protein ACJ8D7_09910, partial [Xanthobacteraceae bacterium]